MRAAAFTLAATLLAMTASGCGEAAQPAPATWDDVAALPAPSVAQRIAYGPEPKQFGDLRLPRGPGPFPVAILVHGGCWQAEYDLEYFGHLADQLALSGIATWNLEYRGIGDAGGAWPGTFDDVAAGAAFLRTLAASHPLDRTRVVLVGHSAGGQLALWLAKRHATDVPVRGVVTLAGIVDLRDYATGAGSCNQQVVRLLGGTPDEQAARYAATSPGESLPIGVPLRLVIGTGDAIVPPASNERFAAQARAQGDDVQLTLVPGASHFDVVMPHGEAADAVRQAVGSLLLAQ